MAKTYNRLEIEIGKPINSIGIRPVAGDTNSRYLDVSLYDNGVPINLTGHQVRINYLKSKGLSFFNQGEITDAAAGRCQFALTNDVISDVQTLKAQISIWGGDSEILSTETFNIYVSENIRCDEAVEGTNEFGALVVLFNEIQNALDLMQAIHYGFGEPGTKAAEYGVNTLWGILEILAGRTDVESVLIDYIKSAINSTLGTGSVSPLNEMLLNNILPMFTNGVQIFTSNGTFTVPKGINKIWVTAFGGGGGGSHRGGQGGDYIVHRVYPVSPLQKINITIGKGGTGRTDSAEATNGGSTIVGNLVTVLGGNAGNNTGDDWVRTIRGAKGGYRSSDSSKGEYGENTEFALGGLGGISISSSLVGGGGGGAGYGNGGNGGDGDYSPGTGGNGGIGAGGGGYAEVISSSNPNKPGIGGNGGDGIVIIEW